MGREGEKKKIKINKFTFLAWGLDTIIETIEKAVKYVKLVWVLKSRVIGYEFVDNLISSPREFFKQRMINKLSKPIKGKLEKVPH